MGYKPGESGNPETQFKPGQSGNPAGRPKGIKNITTYLRESLGVTFKTKNPLTEEEISTTPANIINLTLVKQAMAGNIKAINIILDRMEGKVKQEVGLSGGVANIPTERPQLSDDELRKIINIKRQQS